MELLTQMLDAEDPINGFHGDLNAHQSQYNALHYAALNGHLDCVQVLLRARVDPHVRTRLPYGGSSQDALTACQLAEDFGWDDVAEVLRAAEATEPKGDYLLAGPLNGAKIYPPGLTAFGRDPQQARRVEDRLRGLRGPYFLEAAEQPTTVGLLFPGQGSQYVKMLGSVKDMPAVQALLATAKQTLGWDVLDVCLNGPGSTLDGPARGHPSLFVAACAALERLKTEQPLVAERPGAVAGLGPGELAALVAAGALSFEDALRVVGVLGDALAEASSQGAPQAMLSVAGLRRERLAELCRQVQQAAGEGAVCAVASDLFPKGATFAGTRAELEQLAVLAKDSGALQAKLVTSCGALHTPLMRPAVQRVAEALRDVVPRMRPPKCDVYMSSTGIAVPAGSAPEALVYPLLRQLTGPVRWEACVRAMVKAGINEFREVGPSKHLKAMMKRIDPVMFERTENVEV